MRLERQWIQPMESTVMLQPLILGGGSVNCRNASKDDSLLGMRLNALNGHMGFLGLAKVLERSPIGVFSRGGGEFRERSTFLHA